MDAQQRKEEHERANRWYKALRQIMPKGDYSASYAANPGMAVLLDSYTGNCIHVARLGFPTRSDKLYEHKFVTIDEIVTPQAILVACGMDYIHTYSGGKRGSLKRFHRVTLDWSDIVEGETLEDCVLQALEKGIIARLDPKEMAPFFIRELVEAAGRNASERNCIPCQAL